MTFKEKIASLKAKLQAKITAESTPEQLEEINDLSSELDEVETNHNAVVTENAKLKDTIVRMVQTQGSSDTPREESGGSKPMTIDEVVAEIEKGGK